MLRDSSTFRHYGNMKLIRGLIWAYFFFLMFEGFLRMVLPSLSNVLLVVRDPILISAYLVAHVSRVFPWNRFVVMFLVLGFIAVICGYLLDSNSIIITLYGFRVAFLHAPLIFLLPNVMDERDVTNIGRWVLLLSIPIAILMAVQFNYGPDHWLNRGLDMQFKQIGSAAGKIRPPGTFTYTLGPSIYFGLVVAFLMYGQFKAHLYPKWLLAGSSIATCLALAVSGSRYALACVAGVVLLTLLGVVLARPKTVTSFVKFAFLVGFGLLIASQFSIFSEGVDVFSERIDNASGTEGGSAGFVNRIFGEFIAAYNFIPTTELSGEGIGVGSNVAAVLLGDRRGFLLAESEWSKMIQELGPIIGVIYLGMRTGLVGWLFVRCIQAGKLGSMLPIMLFGSCSLIILNGQWGQPTVLGFAVLGGGLTIASMKRTDAEEPERSPA